MHEENEEILTERASNVDPFTRQLDDEDPLQLQIEASQSIIISEPEERDQEGRIEVEAEGYRKKK